jgi:hypothetical protein
VAYERCTFARSTKSGNTTAGVTLVDGGNASLQKCTFAELTHDVAPLRSTSRVFTDEPRALSVAPISKGKVLPLAHRGAGFQSGEDRQFVALQEVRCMQFAAALAAPDVAD